MNKQLLFRVSVDREDTSHLNDQCDAKGVASPYTLLTSFCLRGVNSSKGVEEVLPVSLGKQRRSGHYSGVRLTAIVRAKLETCRESSEC